MKAARARVVQVKIVHLTRDEEDAMLCGIASIKAGKGLRLEQVRAILRRL